MRNEQKPTTQCDRHRSTFDRQFNVDDKKNATEPFKYQQSEKERERKKEA